MAAFVLQAPAGECCSGYHQDVVLKKYVGPHPVWQNESDAVSEGKRLSRLTVMWKLASSLRVWWSDPLKGFSAEMNAGVRDRHADACDGS